MMFLLLSLLLPTLSSSEPSEPHYIDGVHQPHADEALQSAEALLAEHTCASLRETYGTYYGRDPTVYERNAEAEADVRAALDALQRPPPATCATRRLLLYTPHECGLGAELHWMSFVLQLALLTNRTLVLREDAHWLYADAEQHACVRAGGGRWSCFFEPISTCTARNAAELRALLGDDYGAAGVAGVQRVNARTATTGAAATAARVVRFTENLQQQLDPQFGRAVPPVWETKLWQYGVLAQTTSLFWWRSQLIAYVWRPAPPLLAYAATRRARLALPAAHRLLAVHTRRGDKVLGSPSNDIEMADVGDALPVALAEALALRCGAGAIDGIYYASRDPRLIRRLRAHYGGASGGMSTRAAPLRGYWDEVARDDAADVDYSTHELSRGALNRTLELYEVVKDVTFMAEAAAFLGTMESNLSRLVNELAAAAHALLLGAPFSVGQSWWRAFP